MKCASMRQSVGNALLARQETEGRWEDAIVHHGWPSNAKIAIVVVADAAVICPTFNLQGLGQYDGGRWLCAKACIHS